MQMLAKTMATGFKKGNDGCFIHWDKNHLKRDCPKKAHKELPKVCLSAVGECIGPKSVNLNLILKENLFWETPSKGPPPGPLQ